MPKILLFHLKAYILQCRKLGVAPLGKNIKGRRLERSVLFMRNPEQLGYIFYFDGDICFFGHYISSANLDASL